MNPLDMALVLGVAGACFAGWRFRAIGLLGLGLALGAGVLAANRYAGDLAPALHRLPAGADAVAWLVPFALTAGSVLAAAALASALVAWIRLRWLDRLLGALLAGFCMLVLAALALTAAAAWSPTLPSSRLIGESRLARPLLDAAAPWLPTHLRHPGARDRSL